MSLQLDWLLAGMLLGATVVLVFWALSLDPKTR